MSISKVSLVNAALLELGQERLSNLDGDDLPTQVANDLFDDLLDQELQCHNWTFARSRMQLAAESSGPDFEWTYSHILPANPYCLHVLSEYNDYDYAIEGRKLLSDDTPVQIKYIYRITDYNELSAAFRKAFRFLLASSFAIPLIGSKSMKDTMKQTYEIEIQKAKSRDSQQEPTGKIVDDNDIEALSARTYGVI